MYLAVARTPNEINTVDGKKIAMHLLFVQQVDGHQEMVPVFLSKLQAYLYLKPAGLLAEFQLVSLDSVLLTPYRHAAKRAKKSTISLSSVWCQIGLGLVKKGHEYHLALHDKRYSLQELFFAIAKIEQEMAAYLGPHYQTLVANNPLSDEEMVEAAERLMGSQAKSLPSRLLASLVKRLKAIFFKQANSPVEKRDTKTSEDDNKPVEQIVEQNLREYVGASYGFILKNQDGTLFAPQEAGKHVIAVFINKLDAVIYALMLYEKLKQDFDIIAFKSNDNPLYFKGIKKGYEAGKLRFRMIYGFLGTQTPLGTQGGKYEATSEVPSLVATDCPLSEIEQGIDLRLYFAYVQGAQEREVAITGLINTNLTPTEKLKRVANKVYADMKANLVTVEQDVSKSFHRLIAVSV